MHMNKKLKTSIEYAHVHILFSARTLNLLSCSYAVCTIINLC